MNFFPRILPGTTSIKTKHMAEPKKNYADLLHFPDILPALG